MSNILINDKITKKEAEKNKIQVITQEEFKKKQQIEDNKHKEFIERAEWMKQCQWGYKKILYGIETNENKDGNVLYQVKELKEYINTLPSIIHIQENLDALFKYHPYLNTFKHDTFSRDDIFNGDIYDEDTKPAEIFNFFKRNFGEWCPRVDIKESIQESLNHNECNIPCDIFESLVWDGEERLEEFLIKYYNAEDTPLNRVYFKRWLIALVKRCYEPGCKFDNMLVLYGEQGKKKSSLFEWLGTLDNKNFCNHLPQDLRDIKNLVYATKNAFIMMNDDFEDICDKGNIGVIKEFITKRNDRTDLKYKHAKDYPRHYVLCATTNTNNFLSDDKTFDERRFWIVEVNPDKLEFDLTEELKQQLYAEAVYLYKENPNMKLWINEPELIEAEKELQKKYKNAYVDPISDKIYQIFSRKYPIVNGEFDDEDHFLRCMEEYHGMTKNWDKAKKSTDKINNVCGDIFNDFIGEDWNYIYKIPSNWLIRYLKVNNPRSTDRIIQILHTQGFKVKKQPKTYYKDYGYLTTIIINR